MKRVPYLLLATILLVLGAGRAPAAPKGSPWNENFFPNVELIDQDGKKMKFYDDMLKDKVVMINFIFTTCQDACPLETAKLRQVQERLGDRVGRDVFMYSISITPEHDTPEVLKEYSESFHVGPGWKFMTGKAADIEMLRKKLGLEDDEKREAGEGHGMSMIVGNEKTGVWMKRSSFDNPKVLAKVVSERLLNFRDKSNVAGYEQTSAGLTVNPGEDLFRRRCQDCHTVGAGDAIGPDLEGVTERREHAWLAKYIMKPGEVLASGDPIAKALFEKHHRIPMPNLGMSEEDVEVLIGYLDSQNKKLKQAVAEDQKTQPQQAAAMATHGGHHH